MSKLTIKFTGIFSKDGRFYPTFDMIVDGTVMARMTGGGHYFQSEAEAAQAADRVLTYFDEHSMFPNMCAPY